jgi:hypothetical protein
MGFLGQTSVSKSLPVVVLLEGFQIQATLPYYGTLQMFINDEQRTVFTLNEATMYGLERGNPAASMVVPELWVRKDSCHALIFERGVGREEAGLLPRAESLAFYTLFYAIQGDYHMAPDAMLSDFMDVQKGVFLGVSHANIFPLFQPQSAVVQRAEMAFVHRDVVRMHHKI